MKRILLTCTILVSFTLKSQKAGIEPEVNLLVNSVSSDFLRSYVEKLVGFGTRHTMSSTSDPVKGIGAARSWVLSKFRTFAANSDGRMNVYLQNQDVRPDGKRISKKTCLGNPVALLKGTDLIRHKNLHFWRTSALKRLGYDGLANSVARRQ